jgi:NADP-reducing hydrogenase subunit HndB
MAKIKSMDDLNNIKKKAIENNKGFENKVQVKVAMATCGIASGAREVMNYMIDELANQGVEDVVVTQVGCMGYCYAEPTIEVTKPLEEPVVYGDVTLEKAKEIIQKHIINGKIVEGVIPRTHKTIDE